MLVPNQHPLLELEHAAWVALSTEGEAAPFYRRMLAGRVLILLPGGMVIDDRDAVIESMGGDPWASFEMSDERVMELGPDAAIVAYRAIARRGDQDYSALFASTYVHENGEWRLAVHQQTPD